MYALKKIFNPEIYQGKYKVKNYFEGWYYKLVDSAGDNAIAVIPGISYGEAGEGHAFIQINSSTKNQTHYFKFSTTDFEFSKDKFEIKIGDNYFNDSGIKLNLKTEGYEISGKLNFINIISLPKKITCPGIMGPYSFVPFMECYHGVINLQHEIVGDLTINTKKILLTKGKGYIEKDWGRSFPSWWIWIQSNHFAEKDTSLMFSVAKIPWIKWYFDGFLCIVNAKGKLYKFATYTGAKISALKHENNTVHIEIKDKKHTLKLTGQHNTCGTLKAPEVGLMVRNIEESINSVITIELIDNKGNAIYTGIGKHAGMEIVKN